MQSRKSVEWWIKNSFGEDEVRLMLAQVPAARAEAAKLALEATLAQEREAAKRALQRLADRIATLEATAKDL